MFSSHSASCISYASGVNGSSKIHMEFPVALTFVDYPSK